jgi:hypothetical protein
MMSSLLTAWIEHSGIANNLMDTLMVQFVERRNIKAVIMLLVLRANWWNECWFERLRGR